MPTRNTAGITSTGSRGALVNVPAPKGYDLGVESLLVLEFGAPDTAGRGGAFRPDLFKKMLWGQIPGPVTQARHMRESEFQFSMIVPAYNSEAFLEKSVASLLGRDFDPRRFEILVVDDCSTDATPGIAEASGEWVV